MEYCEQSLQKKRFLYDIGNHSNRRTATEYELGLYQSKLREEGVKNLDSQGCVSKDSGLDLDSDSRSNVKLGDSDNDITMRDLEPETLLPGQGQGFFRYRNSGEYDGGSLMRWRIRNGIQEQDDRNPDGNKRGSAHFRNSLHWEEFFGN